MYGRVFQIQDIEVVAICKVWILAKMEEGSLLKQGQGPSTKVAALNRGHYVQTGFTVTQTSALLQDTSAVKLHLS